MSYSHTYRDPYGNTTHSSHSSSSRGGYARTRSSSVSYGSSLPSYGSSLPSYGGSRHDPMAFLESSLGVGSSRSSGRSVHNPMDFLESVVPGGLPGGIPGLSRSHSTRPRPSSSSRTRTERTEHFDPFDFEVTEYGPPVFEDYSPADLIDVPRSSGSRTTRTERAEYSDPFGTFATQDYDDAPPRWQEYRPAELEDVPRTSATGGYTYLPKRSVRSSDLDESGKASCTICMEDVKVGSQVTTLPCAHFFHGHCVTPWLEQHSTCPLCRGNVEARVPGSSRGGDRGSSSRRRRDVDDTPFASYSPPETYRPVRRGSVSTSTPSRRTPAQEYGEARRERFARDRGSYRDPYEYQDHLRSDRSSRRDLDYGDDRRSRW